MKYYERCKLTVAIPMASEFDEPAIREAVIQRLPGIEVLFKRDSSTEVLEVTDVFVPPDHVIVGAAEQNPATKEWVSVGARNIFATASEVLNRINERKPNE
jgi:hypothetical protein